MSRQRLVDVHEVVLVVQSQCNTEHCTTHETGQWWDKKVLRGSTIQRAERVLNQYVTEYYRSRFRLIKRVTDHTVTEEVLS